VRAFALGLVRPLDVSHTLTTGNETEEDNDRRHIIGKAVNAMEEGRTTTMSGKGQRLTACREGGALILSLLLVFSKLQWERGQRCLRGKGMLFS
jgi:hypothetical protein